MQLVFLAVAPYVRIDFRPLKPLFAFSSKLLITNIANQLNNNLLSVILGKYFNPQAVGNYNQANKWNATGHQFITGMMGSVAQPVLASISDDRERSCACSARYSASVPSLLFRRCSDSLS